MKYKLSYKSDKDWCIQEFDDDGNQLGEDFTPAPETFTERFNGYSSSITYSSDLKTLIHSDDEVNESIYVVLKPISRHLYVFGTNRGIEEYELNIHRKSDDIRKSHQELQGSFISIFELDNKFLCSIDTIIDDDKFDELKELVINKKIDGLSVSANITQGVYWNKGYQTKIYSEQIENELEIPNDIDFNPPSCHILSEPLKIRISSKKTLHKYPYQEVESIVDKVLNHRKIYGTLQTIKFSIIFILAFILIESIKNNYFS